MELTFGRRISGLRVGGKELRAAVFNENEVRAAAGLTMVLGAIAFFLAILEQQYVPLQAVTVLFFIEFVIRLTVGLHFSPLGLVARALTYRQPPEWVSAKPKRFAWSIGVVLSFAMVVITNTGIRGALPATICLICLTLMWTEAVLGVCLGCELHAFLVRHGWTTKDEEYEVCSGGACELPKPPAVATDAEKALEPAGG